MGRISDKTRRQIIDLADGTRFPSDIAAVMDALRQKALAAGVDHFGPDQIQPEQAAEVPQPGLVGVYRKLAT